jgi:hypothetical protein
MEGFDEPFLNNGTDTAKSVETSALFYDDRGRTIGY